MGPFYFWSMVAVVPSRITAIAARDGDRFSLSCRVFRWFFPRVPWIGRTGLSFRFPSRGNIFLDIFQQYTLILSGHYWWYYCRDTILRTIRISICMISFTRMIATMNLTIVRCGRYRGRRCRQGFNR
uniref:Putative secreted peptide n=1 Tax=Anopheles braziliensis TaxID=58242 RepID=A0A2M3ZUC9_9DIPT